MQNGSNQSAQLTQSEKQRARFHPKLVIAVLLLLIVGGVAVAGGVAYLGYIAKKRVTAATRAAQKGDFGGLIDAAKGKEDSAQPDTPHKEEKKDLLGGLMSAVTGNEGKPQPLPEWKPAPPELVSSPPVQIPLIASLQIDDVGTDRQLGDFESVYRIDSLTSQAIHIHASQQYPEGQGFGRLFKGTGGQHSNLNKIACGRAVLMKDFANATESDGYFCRPGRDERHPGTIATFFSKSIFNELKTNGQAQFTFHDDPLHAVFKSFKAAMTASDQSTGAQDAAAQDLVTKMMSFAPDAGNTDPVKTPPIPCLLRRENPDVAFPVVVNDVPTQVPAIKVTCKPDGSDSTVQILVLDNPDNPIILASGSIAVGYTQVTKISWDQLQKDESGLAQSLEKDGRAKVYDLYFDFRSDVLRPESDKVLLEIAQVMKQHLNWNLGVEGNTDNIGNDAYNLDLSQRRAAAVKAALVKSFGIRPDRLVTSGYGATNPIDSNDTIEGRARNRRVELVRR